MKEQNKSEIQRTNSHEKALILLASPFAMLGVSLITGIIVFILGALLTATVIGAIIGIPMMVGGVIAVVASPVIGLGGGVGLSLIWRKAQCPYCHNPIRFYYYQKGITCFTCHKRLLVKGKELAVVE